MAEPVALTDPPASEMPVALAALGALTVPEIEMAPLDVAVPWTLVATIAVAVVAELTDPVTVSPPVPANKAAVGPISTPVPEAPPTVALPVTLIDPLVPLDTYPLMTAPLPEADDGLL